MFSSKFPEGLRVLVFDEDSQYLIILEEHLQEFKYKVTSCKEEKKAMYLLRNHGDKFDIAILEAQDSNGDSFRLLSEIGSEIKIIITSKDNSIQSVINWIRNGACDYLIKPIRREDLRLIFKHVVKKMEVRRSVAAKKSYYVVGDTTIRNPNKRKRSTFLDGEAEKGDQNHYCDSNTKERRVSWIGNLHSKFVEAVDYFGIEKAVPKKILERMNIESITRENVASHLQKFRMSIKKQTDQNMRNQSLTTLQGRMYSGEVSNEFHRGINVQLPTHISDLPQPSSVTQQFISSLGHPHDNEVYVPVFDRNLVITHQHHHPQQVLEFACIDHNAKDNLAYNEYDVGFSNSTCWFTQNSEEMSFLNLHEPGKHVHEPSMVHILSFPSPLTHSSFHDQQRLFHNRQQINNLIDENDFLDNPRSGSAGKDQDGSRSGAK